MMRCAFLAAALLALGCTINVQQANLGIPTDQAADASGASSPAASATEQSATATVEKTSSETATAPRPGDNASATATPTIEPSEAAQRNLTPAVITTEPSSTDPGPTASPLPTPPPFITSEISTPYFTFRYPRVLRSEDTAGFQPLTYALLGDSSSSTFIVDDPTDQGDPYSGTSIDQDKAIDAANATKLNLSNFKMSDSTLGDESSYTVSADRIGSGNSPVIWTAVTAIHAGRVFRIEYTYDPQVQTFGPDYLSCVINSWDWK